MRIDETFKIKKRKKEIDFINFVTENIYFSDDVNSRFAPVDYENWVSLLDRKDKETFLFKIIEAYDLICRIENINKLKLNYGHHDYDFSLWRNTDENDVDAISDFEKRNGGNWNLREIYESNLAFQKGIPVFLKKWNEVENISQYMKYLKPLNMELFKKELDSNLKAGESLNRKYLLIGKELADIEIMLSPLNEIAESFINKSELKNYLLETWNKLDVKNDIPEDLYIPYITSLSKVFEPAIFSEKYVEIFNEKMAKLEVEMELSNDRENHWDFERVYKSKDIEWIENLMRPDNIEELFVNNLHKLDLGEYKNLRSEEEVNGEYIVKYNARKVSKMMFLLNESKYRIANVLKLDYPTELNNYLHIEESMNNKIYYRESVNYFLRVTMDKVNVDEDKIKSIVFPKISDNEDEIKNLVFKIPASKENNALLDIVAQAYMVGSMVASGEYLVFSEAFQSLLLDWNMKRDAGLFKSEEITEITSKRKINKW